MAWSTWDATNIFGSTMVRMNSPGVPITSTGSNRSGASPKRQLAKFNGTSRKTFDWHLKETKFHFNHRQGDLYKTLLKLLRENPLHT